MSVNNHGKGHVRISIFIWLVLLSSFAKSSADQPDLGALIRQLEHEDAEQREIAAGAIGDIGPKGAPAIPALVLAIKDRNPDVSVAAIYAIGNIGPDAREAVPSLVAAFSDTRKASWGSMPGGPATVKLAAWHALFGIGAPAAHSVAPFLKSESGEQRALAAMVISAAGRNADPYVPEILALLHDDEEEVRYSAIDALGEIKSVPDVTIPALVATLNSEDVDLRIRATLSLSQYGRAGSKAVAALKKQLSHDDSTLRGHAAYSLGRIGEAAAPALPELRGLNNDNGVVFNFNNFVSEHGRTDAVKEWAQAAVQRIETSNVQNVR